VLSAGPGEDRLALAILASFAAARLLFAFTIDLGVDESYTVAISRTLSLSYFDHPPLHLWLVHFAARALGENGAARVPFIGLFFVTGWIYYRLASGLFGAPAALIALFALNITPFFFASAGSWIVPDGPLLLGLVIAAWAAARVFFRDSLDEALAWRLWLLVGVGLGLAGLSKYSAVLTASGLATFIVISPEQRHWLKHPAPYVAALIACAMITPVVSWNAQHDWVSFAFQGGRGLPSGQLRLAQWATMALGEIAFLSPWIFVPLVAGLTSAVRLWRDPRRLFLLCLSLPPIALFTLTPLWGGRGQPHWTMPGWFFAFALMGAWIAELGVSVRVLRRCAFLASGLLAAIAGVAVVQASTGWPWVIFAASSRDPMLESFGWGNLIEAPIFVQAPSFVISTKWSDAGKIALALGPQVPVFVLSNDPRGWALLDESERHVGQNGVIVTPAAEVAPTLAIARSLFHDLGPPQPYALGRRGRPEIRLALIPANGLTRRLPVPYPTAAGR
jgi:4-amino-4-deoxy-L-arabinose transferase-like glycosyltransferase